MRPANMIDLETYGLTPGSVFTQIGYCFFNERNKDTPKVSGCIRISLVSAMQYGLKLDAETVEWWMQQDDAARQQMTKPGLPLPKALQELTFLMKEHNTERVWANSPNFDICLLEAAYRLCGLKPFWSHKMIYDVRTLVKLSGIERHDNPFLHQAEYDAVSQAIDVQNAFQALKIP